MARRPSAANLPRALSDEPPAKARPSMGELPQSGRRAILAAAMSRNPNTFANSPLNRASEKRSDKAWLEACLADPTTHILPLWQLKPFVTMAEAADESCDIGWLAPGELSGALSDQALCLFLGEMDGRAHFALDIRAEEDPGAEAPFNAAGTFAELRDVAAKLQPGEAAIIAQARSMIDWHGRHKFCANCGAKTAPVEAGYKRECSACGAEHFPRTDPVVITLVVKGDRCLLGRSARFPGNMYSCLAGFIEPGESVEEAVVREIEEEVGVTVSNIRYHSTQPWPYPSSLMIGCIADALDDNFRVDGVEIESALWLSREEVLKLVNGEERDDVRLPPPMAIAHQLVRAWALGEE